MPLRRRRWPVRRLISCCAAILCVYPRRRSSRSSTPARSLTRGLRASWGFLEPWEAASPAAWAPRCEECRRVFSSDPAPSSPQGRWVDVPDARSCPPRSSKDRGRPPTWSPGTRTHVLGLRTRSVASLRACGRQVAAAGARQVAKARGSLGYKGLQGKIASYSSMRGHPHTHATRLYDPRYPPPAPPLSGTGAGVGCGRGRGRDRDRSPLPPWITPPTLNPLLTSTDTPIGYVTG